MCGLIDEGCDYLAVPNFEQRRGLPIRLVEQDSPRSIPWSEEEWVEAMRPGSPRMRTHRLTR